MVLQCDSLLVKGGKNLGLMARQDYFTHYEPSQGQHTTVMILSFWTDRSGQTVQTQISGAA